MGIQERKQRQKEGLRQDILDAARELFVQTGYDSLSMRKLAERIEYSPTTIYLYFRDKADLLDCLCEEAWTALGQQLQAIAQESKPVEGLRRSLRAYVACGLRHPSQYKATFLHEPPLPRTSVASAACLEGIRHAVRRCVEGGKFASDDVEETSQALWASVHGLTSLAITRPSTPLPAPEQLAIRLADVLVAGAKRA